MEAIKTVLHFIVTFMTIKSYSVKSDLKEKSNWPDRVLLKENLSAMRNKNQGDTFAVLFPEVFQCDFLGEFCYCY